MRGSLQPVLALLLLLLLLLLPLPLSLCCCLARVGRVAMPRCQFLQALWGCPSRGLHTLALWSLMPLQWGWQRRTTLPRAAALWSLGEAVRGGSSSSSSSRHHPPPLVVV